MNYKKDIDKDLRITYRNIFRKSLINVEKWSKFGNNFDIHIESLESSLSFTVKSDDDYKYFHIDKNGNNIYTFKINFFDFKTKKLLKKLKNYMKNRDVYKKIGQANDILRTSLGQKYDRSQKLKTINKKSS